MDLIGTYTKALEGYIDWLWNDQVLIETESLFGNYFWGLALISITFFIIEIVVPWRKNQALFRKQFWQDAFYMYFNFFIFYIVLFVGLSAVAESISVSFFNFIGIENLVILFINELPTWVQLLIVFVITDFTHWNIHRLLHRYPLLWRFHRLHHSIKEMGFAGHLRFHWIESIIYKSITYFPLLIIGFEEKYLFYIHLITISWGHFNHANINVPLGILKYIFNSPQMHIWHHAKEMPEEHKTGANFGLTLSIWDYVFKTSYLPSSGRDIELGFEGDEDYPKSFIKQILSGFIK
jgi:sterol desaturase/sphingolipid hydroxylase (fatty acid hydroxylase superfamily)